MLDDATVSACLDDLESRLDDAEEERLRREWAAYLEGKWPGEFFSPSRRTPRPPKVPWPRVTTNQAIGDFNAMLLQQFGAASDALRDGASRRLNVRCNYGTGILPCLFGCGLFMMDEETNTLPTAVPFNSAEKVRELLRKGVPDLRAGLGAKVFECGRRFVEVMSRYPRVRRWVAVIHPDLQGPVDVLEVVWGSEFFYAIYDDLPLFQDFLALVTETYIAFLREWQRIVPPTRPYSDHWGMMHKGVVMLRADSLMNLPPDFYAERIRPADERVFAEFGGGAIHFCGRGDHFIEEMSRAKGLTAVNLSQPHCNNMEIIYRNTVDKGLHLLNLKRETAESAGRPLRGMVHVA